MTRRTSAGGYYNGQSEWDAKMRLIARQNGAGSGLLPARNDRSVGTLRQRPRLVSFCFEVSGRLPGSPRTRPGKYLAITEESSCAIALSGKRVQTSSIPRSGMPRKPRTVNVRPSGLSVIWAR